jgi:hypothetical protein
MGSRYSIEEWNKLFAMQQQYQQLQFKLANPDILLKKPFYSQNTENDNKIDLAMVNNNDNKDKREITTCEPINTIESQIMQYGILGRIIPYNTSTSSVNVTATNGLSNPTLKNNKLLQRGATVLGVFVLAGAWLFGY